MPHAPPRVCPQCRQAIPAGRPCPTCHKPWSTATSWATGSTHRWRKLRARILADEPTCRACGRLATTVDHITPLEHGGARYDPANCQPLCQPCHDSKTDHETHPMPTHLVAVTGPPCSGKTTYVHQHRGPRDLVIDYDALAVALGSPVDHDHDPALIPFITEARDALLRRAVRRSDLDTIWIVTTAHTVPQADDTITLDTSRAECRRRARQAGRSSDTLAAIDRWFTT